MNSCSDRLAFINAFVAAMDQSQGTVLPSAPVSGVIRDLHAQFAGDGGCEIISDVRAAASGHGGSSPAAAACSTDTPLTEHAWPDAQLAIVASTSGSSGAPQQHRKCWGALRASTADNRHCAALADVPHGATILATVPSQHMYGFEMTVLLPLLTDLRLSPEMPFYPHDVAAALGRIDGPVVLVTTPPHLRVLLGSSVDWPPLARIVSATAPLCPDAARLAETRFGCEVHELFGSTETCVIAHRRPAHSPAWRPHRDVRISPTDHGALVDVPSRGITAQPLADHVEMHVDGRFFITGRRADLVKVAGKRASLAELNLRLLALPQLADGVLLQEHGNHGRLTALVQLAPHAHALSDQALRQLVRRGLADHVDPVFLPRAVLRCESLPRNAVGKLPAAALRTALADARRG